MKSNDVKQHLKNYKLRKRCNLNVYNSLVSVQYWKIKVC